MTVTTPAPTPPVHPHPPSLCPSDIVTLSQGHRLDRWPVQLPSLCPSDIVTLSQGHRLGGLEATRGHR
jgi:hypothetical protein